MIKKLFSSVLIFVFVLQLFFVAHADEVIKIEAESYSDYYDTTEGNVMVGGVGSDDVETVAGATGVVVSVDAAEWIEYKVTAPKKGSYTLTINGAVREQATMPLVKISTDGQEALEYILPTTGGRNVYADIVIGDITLKSGENTIKILTEQKGFMLDYFQFEYVGEVLKMVGDEECIEAESADDAPETLLDEATGTVVALSEDEEIKYTLGLETEGVYSLSAFIKGEGQVAVKLNDETVIQKLLRADDYEEVYFGNILLCEGKNILSIIAEGNLKLDYFNLLKFNPDEEFGEEKIILEAENADRKEGNMTVGASGSVKYVSFNQGRALEFDISLPYSGLYQISVNSALSVTFYEKQTLNITIGGQTKSGTTYPTESFYDWEPFLLCGMFLEAGDYTLRIAATYGGTHIDNFVVEYLGNKITHRGLTIDDNPIATNSYIPKDTEEIVAYYNMKLDESSVDSGITVEADGEDIPIRCIVEGRKVKIQLLEELDEDACVKVSMEEIFDVTHEVCAEDVYYTLYTEKEELGACEIKDVSKAIFYRNIKVEGTFVSQTGNPVSGETIEMNIKAPDGTVSEGAVCETSTTDDGKFVLEYTLPKNSASGIYEIILVNRFIKEPYSLTVDYTQSDVLTVQAESYAEVSEAVSNTYNSITYMSATENGYLTYDLYIPENGKYAIDFRASGTDRAFVNLSLDSIPLMAVDIAKTGSVKSFDENIVICDFSKGTYKLKISVTTGTLNLDYFSISMLYNVTDDICDSFVAEINKSVSGEEVYNTLVKYKDKFGIDITSYINNVFYTEPIFDELASHTYEDVTEILKRLNAVAKQYKKTPDVSMYKGNTFLSKLESGDLTMLVRTHRLTEPVMVVGAIYKDFRLYKLNCKEFTNQTSISIPFEGIEIDDSCTYSFKAFYVNNLNSVIPYDAYPNVYREIYVSPFGSDENPGTKELPLKTLGGAKDILTEITPKMMGDIIVNIEPGEYFLPKTEVFNNAHGGKNGYNVIIQGTDKQNYPILHGGRKITGWEIEENGIYSAPLSDVADVRNLYVDGFAATRARSEDVFSLEGFADGNGDGINDSIYVKTKRLSHTFERPQDLEAVWELNWSSHRMPIDGCYVKDDKTYFEVSPAYLGFELGTDSIEIKRGRAFFLENAMELLDKPGEFYYNKEQERIYYYPHNGESLENVYIPTTEFLFEVGDSSGAVTENIIFSSLDIRYGNWSEPSSRGIKQTQADKIFCLDENGEIAETYIPAQFAVNNSKGIQILDCKFSCLGSNAVSMKDKVSDSKIVGNVIKDVSGSAISIGSWEHVPNAERDLMSKNIHIENNLIRRTGQYLTGTVAISVYYANSIKICHNDIADVPYSGITLGWGWGYNAYTMGNFSVCHNRIADVMNTLIDGSHIYTLGPLKDSAVFENYTEDSKYILSGIYTDSGSSLLKIFKNVFYEEDEDCIWWYQGHKNTKNLHAFSNYTNLTKVEEHGEGNVYEDTRSITEGNYPEEALAIKENAGLTEEYKHLLANSELPSYKESLVKISPKDIYVNGYYKAAYKYDSSYDPTTTNVTVGIDYASFNSGEWMEYIINAEEAGTYNMLLFAAQGWADGATANITIHLNGQQILSGTVPNNGTWSVYEEYDFGKINLIKGENRIRIYNTKGGFHLNSFMLEK